MNDRDTPHNPPAAAMVEPAPMQDRAIRSKLDAAVDATFPASDPIAMEDPARGRPDPVLPADARPGDVIGEPPSRPRGAAIAARQRNGQDAMEVLRWIWPWALAGIAMQLWWSRRRR